MKDFYLYEDVPVLKNKLNIKDSKALEKAESDITYVRLFDIDLAFSSDMFDYARLLAIHKYIFGDIYEWAGTARKISITKGERVLGGDTVRYSKPDDIEKDCGRVIKKLNDTDWAVLSIDETADLFSKLIAEMWQVHPFREGNTRSVVTFATQFAEAHGFKIDKILLKESAAYVRDALVKASDGQYSDYQYLVKVFKDAIIRG